MAVQPRARTIVLTLCSALLATTAATLPARAEAPARPASWEVRGPHGSPTAVVSLDPADGSPALAVRRAGRTILEPSPVGLVTEQADFTRDLTSPAAPTARSRSATRSQQASLTSGLSV